MRKIKSSANLCGPLRLCGESAFVSEANPQKNPDIPARVFGFGLGIEKIYQFPPLFRRLLLFLL